MPNIIFKKKTPKGVSGRPFSEKLCPGGNTKADYRSNIKGLTDWPSAITPWLFPHHYNEEIADVSEAEGEVIA